MTLFFVLSGFVIHYNYSHLFQSKSLGQATYEFATARFARLCPLYFAFVIMALFTDNFVQHAYLNPTLATTILAQYLTLSQTWIYYAPGGTLNVYYLYGLSWSISVEVFFYLAYIPLVFLILRLQTSRFALMMASGFTILILTLSALSWTYIDPTIALAKEHITGFVDRSQNESSSFLLPVTLLAFSELSAWVPNGSSISRC